MNRKSASSKNESSLIRESRVSGDDLDITFTSGRTYRYFGAAGEHDPLSSASSQGQYFHANIKNEYESEPLSAAA